MKTFLMMVMFVLVTSCSLEPMFYGLDFSIDLPAGVTTADQALSWTAKNIKYDFAHEKAQEGKSGNAQFFQTPKETVASGLGLCGDYASLDVAFLESLGYDVPIVLTHLPGMPVKSHMCILWHGRTFETQTGEFVDYPQDDTVTWDQFKTGVDYVPNNFRTPY